MPALVVGGKKAFRRRDARLGDGVQVVEEMAFVAPLGIKAATSCQSVAGDGDHLACDVLDAPTAHARLQAKPRYIVEQGCDLRRIPVPADLLRGVECRVVVEQARPEGGERTQAPPRAGIGAALFDIALESHLGEQGGQVVFPVRQCGPFTRQAGQLAGEEVAE